MYKRQTVSKALNGQHDISDATRARVREAAERLGYVPNMAARSMKTNRTHNLGVLFVDERQSEMCIRDRQGQEASSSAWVPRPTRWPSSSTRI